MLAFVKAFLLDVYEGEDEQEDERDDEGGPADNRLGPRFVDLRKSEVGSRRP